MMHSEPQTSSYLAPLLYLGLDNMLDGNFVSVLRRMRGEVEGEDMLPLSECLRRQYQILPSPELDQPK